MMGGAFGLGFVLGPALGGVLGEFGPRVPFFVAAGISGLNFIYGWFVLPETLAPQNRRAFSLARSNPLGAFKVFRSYQGVIPMCAVMFSFSSSPACIRRYGPIGGWRSLVGLRRWSGSVWRCLAL